MKKQNKKSRLDQFISDPKKAQSYLNSRSDASKKKKQKRLLISNNNIVCIIGERLDDRFKLVENSKKVYIVNL